MTRHVATWLLRWWVAVVIAVVCGGAGAAEVKPAEPPTVPANLIANGGFEADAGGDGVPDGWTHSDPSRWAGPAKDSDRWKELRALWVPVGTVPSNIPFRPPDVVEGGAYGWGSPGRLSGHCIWMDGSGEPRWSEWDTVVHGVKRKTDYVVMGWRRQSLSARPAGGLGPYVQAAVFGRLMPVRGGMSRDAWLPFAVEVNSGDFEGDCSLGFILDRVPGKVWLDDVALFEGHAADAAAFLLGRRGAALEYPAWGGACASPDVECPFFFDLSWSFQDGGNEDPGIELVLDLPDGFDVSGGECGDNVHVGPAVAKAVTIEGRPYVRRTFPVAWDRTRATRDGFGRSAVRLWLRTKAAEGSFDVFYRAAWRGGGQAEQQVAVRVVRLAGSIERRVPIVAVAGCPNELAVSRSGIFAKDLPTLGVNGLVSAGGPEAGAVAALEGAGVSVLPRFALGGENRPADAAAKGADGQPVAGAICPTSPVACEAALFADAVALVQQGFTTLVTDLRGGQYAQCFCERCTKEFAEFLHKRNPDLAYVSPVEFTASPDKFVELNAAWREFHAVRICERYWSLRRTLDELRRTAKPKLRNAGQPLRLFAVVPGPSSNACGVDYSRLGAVFDVEIVDCEASVLEGGGAADRAGDEVQRAVKMLPPGGKAGAMISAGRCEGRAFVSPVTRAADVREQTLEALVAGAKGLVLDPLTSADGLVLHEFREALALLTMCDKDVIAQGEPSEAVSSADGKVRVRSLRGGGGLLVLVTNYFEPAVAEARLALNLPDEMRGEIAVMDLEQQTARVLPAGTRELTAPMRGARVKLFYACGKDRLPAGVRRVETVAPAGN